MFYTTLFIFQELQLTKKLKLKIPFLTLFSEVVTNKMCNRMLQINLSLFLNVSIFVNIEHRKMILLPFDSSQ
jgi:hypothetical protein